MYHRYNKPYETYEPFPIKNNPKPNFSQKSPTKPNMDTTKSSKKFFTKKKLNNSKEELNLKPTTKKNKTATNSPSIAKNLAVPNNSGERLYNYGFYIKNKLERKRQEEQKKMLRQMTPKISLRSKSLNKDTPVAERLYYKNSNSPNKRRCSKENLKYNQYTYKPHINANSLKIAKNLEPTSERLFKKKKKSGDRSEKTDGSNHQNNFSFYTVNSPYYKIGLNKSFNNNFSKSPKRNISFEKSNELYMKGMEHKLKIDKIYKEHKEKEEEEYKNYSYKPIINTTSPILLKNQKVLLGKQDKSNEAIYKKNCEWKKKLENENKKKKEKLDKIKQKDYTFKPEISHLNLQNDENFIMKNLAQMNEYVNKRRQALQRKKEDEEYKNKRLGQNLNFCIKPTIPKEFNLSRSKSKGKKGSTRNNEMIYNINKPKAETVGSENFLNAVSDLKSKIDNLDL